MYHTACIKLRDYIARAPEVAHAYSIMERACEYCTQEYVWQRDMRLETSNLRMVFVTLGHLQSLDWTGGLVEIACSPGMNYDS